MYSGEYTIEHAIKFAKQILQTKYSVQQVNIEVYVLLQYVLKKNKAHIIAHSEKKIADTEFAEFEKLIQQRLKGMPVAYLIGNKEFWSRVFKVDNNVLVPRPETELLIELILQHAKINHQLSMLDLGTGSGIIGITVACECPQWKVFALDKSEKAINLAKLNSKILCENKVNYLVGNWCDAIMPNTLDVIVANPPYISINDKFCFEDGLQFEPKTALFSRSDGLEDLYIIIEQSLAKLKNKGLLLLEHGSTQAGAVTKKMISCGYINIQTVKDLQGFERVTLGFVQ